MPRRPSRPAIAWVALALLAGAPAARAAIPAEPPTLKALQEYESPTGADTGKGLQIRAEAVRDAALSYGIRGGLAHRSWEIEIIVGRKAKLLDKVFDFSPMLMAGPSGLTIDPPIIVDGREGVKIADGGQAGAVADRVLRIAEEARIVPTMRTWHTYLDRDWEPAEPPPVQLLPKDDAEREKFRTWVKQGWDVGVDQANQIFQENIDLLTRDFVGMVKYRELRAEEIVTPPYTDLTDRGVTGGGTSLRVGDREVRISAPSALDSRAERWVPSMR